MLDKINRKPIPDLTLILSLMKREGISKMLALMAKKPGLSIQELSAELHMRKDAVSRYLRELASDGVIVQSRRKGAQQYDIKNEIDMRIVRALDYIREK